LWIIDGHNVIFTLPALSRLQMEGERQEARRALERLLEPFAARLSCPLLIVYDGNELPANPDASQSPAMHTLYSQPPEEADDRIIFLAAEARRRDQSVTIVTNDRRSLQVRLAPDVRVIAVEEFCRRFLHSPPTPADEKQVPDAARQEIAGIFLERAPEIEEEARRGARRREKQALARWKARRRTPESAADAPEQQVPDPKPAWRRPAKTRDSSVSSRDAKDDAAAKDALDLAAREARLARKRRGERKQRRRLAARRRSAKGGRRK
jgi:predicted RNA-binding protein with PIN domain